MDKSILDRHLGVVAGAYPNLNINQLGMLVIMLGVIRSSMGHENAIGTIENYIHPNELSKEVRLCLDYLEREVLGIKRSKIDIDYWKTGKRGAFRRNTDKTYTSHGTTPTSYK